MMLFNGGKWEILDKSSAFVSKQSLRLPAAISEHRTGLIVVTGSTRVKHMSLEFQSPEVTQSAMHTVFKRGLCYFMFHLLGFIADII
jgi:hypothetical protein